MSEQPDPATWSAEQLRGKSPEEKLAILRALEDASEALEGAKRGRPLRPGDISTRKGRADRESWPQFRSERRDRDEDDRPEEPGKEEA